MVANTANEVITRRTHLSSRQAVGRADLFARHPDCGETQEEAPAGGDEPAPPTRREGGDDTRRDHCDGVDQDDEESTRRA